MQVKDIMPAPARSGDSASPVCNDRQQVVAIFAPADLALPDPARRNIAELWLTFRGRQTSVPAVRYF